MSEAKAESTSSEELDGSKRWPEVAELGDRIVKEIGLDNSTDTLGRWMAHRIAELMQGADHDEQAKAAATELILRCWERRDGWNSGWPPPAVVSTFEWFDRELRGFPEPNTGKTSWQSELENVRSSLDEEYRAWLRLAMARKPPNTSEPESIWAQKEALRSDVRRLLDLLSQAADESDPSVTQEERALRAKQAIANLQQDRAALLDEIASDIE